MTKSAIILIVLVFGSIVSIGQNISVIFTGTGAATQIDSVKATNLTTNQSVTFPGNETLVLTVNTGMPTVTGLTNMGIVYPNPFSDQATFVTVVQKPQTVYLKIQNLVGQVVTQSKAFVEPGENEFALSVNTAGIYMVTITTDQGTSSYKVICTRGTTAENSTQYLGSRSNNHKNHNNSSQSKLKSTQTAYTLGYTIGDVILYRCRSGIYTTIIADSPTVSKNYEVEFVTCTDKGGKSYSIVKIGTQTWMASNLAYLPAVGSPDFGYYYYVYGYNGIYVSEAKATANFETYGVLYNWNAASTSCPDGWHLPSKAEWDSLTHHLGVSAAARMKETGSQHWASTYANGSNTSGFTALPGGGTYPTMFPGDEFFRGLGEQAHFWSSSKEDAYELGGQSSAWYITLTNGYSWTLVNEYWTHQRYYVSTLDYEYSVRCLRGGLATLTTSEIGQITENSAAGGGNITDDGSEAITSRGVCWSTGPNPTTAVSKTEDGKGKGSFKSILTGLSGNTIYYVRAYAVNPIGTSYGSQVIFKTKPGLSTVRTTAITGITDSYASSGGIISNSGSLTIQERGVCWSVSPNPTVDDNKTTDGSGSGKFTSRMNGLTKNTTYFARAYAINSAGTSYGDQTEFTTAEGSFNYDGRAYGFRTIGLQKWMIENLAYLPGVNLVTADADIYPDYHVYDYQGTSVSEARASEDYLYYGVLYNLEAAKTSCPDGWYLPSDTDWTILTDYLISKGYGFGGSGSSIAKSLAAKWGWNASTKEGTAGYNQNSNDSSGFTALPAGSCTDYGYFYGKGDQSMFWSITDADTLHNWVRTIGYDYTGIFRNPDGNREEGYSVRCLSGGLHLARITTAGITEIAEDSARCGGNISDDGGAEISSRGVCWSLKKNPTVEDNKTIDGSGNGSFYSVLTGLNGNATYYIRAYAINPVGTSYGTNISFRTDPGVPTATTNLITGITDTTAVSGGNISNNGGANIIARGVCWSTSGNPTITDNKTMDGSGSGLFLSNLEKLLKNTNYYVRAYATNSYGTGYGRNISFSTMEGHLVYEGKTYFYKTIGTQTWMTENLAYLPAVNPPGNKSDTSPRYYVYGYNGSNVSSARSAANYKTYGVLYNWPAAMNGAAGSLSVPSGVRGVCPEGWHLPSDREWDILGACLGGSDVAGGKMKEPGTTHWMTPNTGATNSSGFSAKPGGANDYFLNFSNLGMLCEFISTTSENDFWILHQKLVYSTGGLFRYTEYKNHASSVRCLKN